MINDNIIRNNLHTRRIWGKICIACYASWCVCDIISSKIENTPKSIVDWVISIKEENTFWIYYIIYKIKPRVDVIIRVNYLSQFQIDLIYIWISIYNQETSHNFYPRNHLVESGLPKNSKVHSGKNVDSLVVGVAECQRVSTNVDVLSECGREVYCFEGNQWTISRQDFDSSLETDVQSVIFVRHFVVFWWNRCWQVRFTHHTGHVVDHLVSWYGTIQNQNENFAGVHSKTRINDSHSNWCRIDLLPTFSSIK